MDTSNIRKQVKRQMVDLELDGIGMRKQIAAELGINYQQFIMALTGSRSTPRSMEILEILGAYLSELSTAGAA